VTSPRRRGFLSFCTPERKSCHLLLLVTIVTEGSSSRDFHLSTVPPTHQYIRAEGIEHCCCHRRDKAKWLIMGAEQHGRYEGNELPKGSRTF
jgi:hypothetical protein